MRMLAIAFSSLALMATRNASADTASFTWDAPPGCPSSAEVTTRIVQRLRTTSPSTWRVRAHAAADPLGMRVRVETAGAERTIVAPTCDAAADAVAVVVALALDRDGAPASRSEPTKRDESSPRVSDSPSVPVPPVDTSPPQAGREPERNSAEGTETSDARRTKVRSSMEDGDASATRPTRRAEPVHWSLFVAGALDAASLPRSAPGIALGIDGRRGWIGVSGVVSAYLPQTERMAGAVPVEATIGLVDAMGLACALVPVGGVFDAGACAGGGVGLWHGRSRRISAPDSGIGWRPQGEALGRVQVPFSRAFAFRADAGIVVDPVRSPFRVAGVGEVYRAPAVAFRGVAGIEIASF